MSWLSSRSGEPSGGRSRQLSPAISRLELTPFDHEGPFRVDVGRRPVDGDALAAVCHVERGAGLLDVDGLLGVPSASLLGPGPVPPGQLHLVLEALRHTFLFRQGERERPFGDLCRPPDLHRPLSSLDRHRGLGHDSAPGGFAREIWAAGNVLPRTSGAPTSTGWSIERPTSSLWKRPGIPVFQPINSSTATPTPVTSTAPASV